MTRILMTTDAVGGVWHYSITLGACLLSRGVKVELAVIGDPPNAAQRSVAAAVGLRFRKLDVPLDWQAGSARALDKGRRKIADAARRCGADLLHLNQPAYGGADLPTPFVAVAHSCVTTWWRGTRGAAVPPDWRWHSDAVREGLARAVFAVVPSASLGAMLEDAYRIEGVRVVRNGIRPRELRAAKDPVLLAAGRGWDESKNFAALDAAAPRIPWLVRFAGTCAKPGGGVVAFPCLECLGHLHPWDMERELNRASVFVSPSLYEPFGLAVLEAAQHGAALLLSDIATFRELWRGAALFFNPRQPDDLARQANRLIADGGLRQRLSAAAIERAGCYSLDRTAGEMLDLYRQAVRRKPMEVSA